VKQDTVAAAAFGSSRSADYTYDVPLGTLKTGAHLLTIEAKAGSAITRRDVRFSVR
jgi:hypothetical protein